MHIVQYPNHTAGDGLLVMTVMADGPRLQQPPFYGTIALK
jgi:hypothetical protein